ncbi:MAG: YraN family protein [Alphaproteobacteria bacterium]|nr:YraN family protein [Alphaproteobacteria bacterium]
MTNYSAGLFAEFIARMYLRFHGFRILKQRYVTGRYTGRAEIDIIAAKGNLIIFVEVKKRETAAAGASAVTFAQGRRLRFAAETYLLRNRHTGDARFDIIVVSGFRVRWFKNFI